MRTSFGFSGAALGLAAVVGCGGGGKTLNEDEFCDEWAAKECGKVAPKCVLETAPCETARKKVCQSFAAAAKMSSSTRQYRAENAKTCLNQLASSYGRDQISADDLAQVAEDCSRVFQGKAVANDTCTLDYDCEKSLVCDKGHCADKTTVKKNANCGNPGEFCPTGQYCANSASVYVCKDRVGVDMACSAAAPCLEKYRCAATCKTLLGMGQACTAHGDCTTGFCDPYNNICTPYLTFAVGSPSCKGFVGATAGGADAGSTD